MTGAAQNPCVISLHLCPSSAMENNLETSTVTHSACHSAFTSSARSLFVHACPMGRPGSVPLLHLYPPFSPRMHPGLDWLCIQEACLLPLIYMTMCTEG